MNFEPSEKATTIRQPATANLMVESSDRDPIYPSPFDFLINRPNSIMNGFFTRIGLSELYLKWDIPNISVPLNNNTLLLDISGYGVNPITLTFPNQFCGTAAAVLDAIVAKVNDLSGTTQFYFTIAPNQGGLTTLASTTYQLIGNAVGGALNLGFFKFRPTNLSIQMNINSDVLVKYREPTSPDLRPFAYIDFVSPNLTYNQDLKDTTTNNYVVDVLQRFYFASSSQPALDKYNYPILLGYSPFTIDRAYNPPKQIKWDSAQPVGQIQFQVYGQPIPANPGMYGVLNALPSYSTNYGFVCQVSEN